MIKIKQQKTKYIGIHTYTKLGHKSYFWEVEYSFICFLFLFSKFNYKTFKILLGHFSSDPRQKYEQQCILFPPSNPPYSAGEDVLGCFLPFLPPFSWSSSIQWMIAGTQGLLQRPRIRVGRGPWEARKHPKQFPSKRMSLGDHKHSFWLLLVWGSQEKSWGPLWTWNSEKALHKLGVQTPPHPQYEGEWHSSCRRDGKKKRPVWLWYCGVLGGKNLWVFKPQALVGSAVQIYVVSPKTSVENFALKMVPVSSASGNWQKHKTN